MNTKQTPELIKEAKRLYHKEGLKYKAISKEIGISIPTIGLWVNDKKGIVHKNDGIGDHPEEIPLFIRKNIKKQKQSEPKYRIERNLCKVCGKKKQLKWRLTNICSINCFKVLTKPI